MRRLAAGGTMLLVLGIGIVWLAGTILTRGHRTAVPRATVPARDLRIASSGGVVLAATYRPGPRTDAPAILLLHGVDASRGALAANAAWLNRHGYATLAIDFRGHGESTPAPRTFGWNEAADAHAAFAWLQRQQRGARIGVIGISMGGAASLLGPTGPLPADALVLQAVYPDLRHAIRARLASRLGGLAAAIGEPLLSYQTRLRAGVWPDEISPINALPRFKGRVLVIGGREDRSTPVDQTIALRRMAAADASLWIVPTGDHAAISAMADHAYRQKVLAFFDTGLRQ